MLEDVVLDDDLIRYLDFGLLLPLPLVLRDKGRLQVEIGTFVGHLEVVDLRAEYSKQQVDGSALSWFRSRC